MNIHNEIKEINFLEGKCFFTKENNCFIFNNLEKIFVFSLKKCGKENIIRINNILIINKEEKNIFQRYLKNLKDYFIYDQDNKKMIFFYSSKINYENLVLSFNIIENQIFFSNIIYESKSKIEYIKIKDDYFFISLKEIENKEKSNLKKDKNNLNNDEKNNKIKIRDIENNLYIGNKINEINLNIDNLISKNDDEEILKENYIGINKNNFKNEDFKNNLEDFFFEEMYICFVGQKGWK